MKKFLAEVHTVFERNNKKRMISSSGSTPESQNEKIRSGQSFLYQTRGMESEVVEVRFHKKVWGSLLNNALILSLKRYPYLNTKIVELDGDFYIVKTKCSLLPRKHRNYPNLDIFPAGII